MRTRQVLLIATVLFIAVLIQTTLLNRIPFPGTTPELLPVLVVAFAMIYGRIPGAVTGFAAGLLMDIAPPGNGPVGVSALILVIVGFVAGAYTDVRDRTLILIVSVTAASSGALTFVTAALESILGSPRVSWDQLAGVTLAGVFYSVLLAPFLVALLGWAARRLTSEAVG